MNIIGSTFYRYIEEHYFSDNKELMFGKMYFQ